MQSRGLRRPSPVPLRLPAISAVFTDTVKADAMRSPQGCAREGLGNPKVEEEKPERPPGYRKFEKLLKQVVKAPPMRKSVTAEPTT